MIKSISIKNFESHEDTTIRFGDGMNLIVGLSNSGKSAIIRALACVVNNRWDKSMVRTGYEFCRVKVETDKGWVECERGEKVNRWKCQELNGEVQEYKNVGSTVPELATKILGMGERERGADIKELPNFQFQLEKHYMLSEIDGKKATSNMIARMMDNAIGLGGMEDLIKAISTDLSKDRKWLSEKQQEINELKNHIQDEAIFDKKSKLVQELVELGNSLQTSEGALAKASALLSEYENCSEKLSQAQKSIGCLNACDLIEPEYLLLKRNGQKLEQVKKCASIQSKFNELVKILGIDVEILCNTAQELSKRAKAIELCGKAAALEEELKNNQSLISLDWPALSGQCDKVSGNAVKLNSANEAIKKARELWKQHSNSEKELQLINSELSKCQDSFDALKKKLGVCPLCGGKLE